MRCRLAAGLSASAPANALLHPNPNPTNSTPRLSTAPQAGQHAVFSGGADRDRGGGRGGGHLRVSSTAGLHHMAVHRQVCTRAGGRGQPRSILTLAPCAPSSCHAECPQLRACVQAVGHQASNRVRRALNWWALRQRFPMLTVHTTSSAASRARSRDPAPAAAWFLTLHRAHSAPNMPTHPRPPPKQKSTATGWTTSARRSWCSAARFWCPQP